jgi:methylated-DNA-[protein]-cysteine S-methyltransferase
MTSANPLDSTAPGGPLHAMMIESPVGDLRLVASDAGIRAVLWPSDDSSRVPLPTNVEVGDSHPVLVHAARELAEYFTGERQHFDVPLDPDGTVFQQQAWMALRSIPYGETVSYGQQAERMGDKNKARAVGAANGRNPISIIVPCHRVVGSNGSLTGFAGGIETKQWLLAHEQKVAGHTLL